jgi:hypothetical protein
VVVEVATPELSRNVFDRTWHTAITTEVFWVGREMCVPVFFAMKAGISKVRFFVPNSQFLSLMIFLENSSEMSL